MACECTIFPDSNFNALAAYPVGAIYISTVGTSPAVLFGGTWSELPGGRVLINQGESNILADIDFGRPQNVSFTAGEEGGEFEESLGAEHLPPHHHYMRGVVMQGGSGDQVNLSLPIGGASTNAFFSPNEPTTQEGGTELTPVGGSTSSRAEPLSKMQPYLVVYMWKRTA